MKRLVLITALVFMATTFLAMGSSPFSFEVPQKGPKYGKDSATCVVNISLYREFYKQWKNSGYKADRAAVDAIKPWRWVFLNCPLGTQNTYIDGVKLVEFLIKQQTEKEKKEAYIDTLMMVYDQRIAYFGREGYVLGRKGVDLYQNRPSAYEEVFKALDRSVELEGTKTASAVLVYYFRAALEMNENAKLDMTRLVDIYDKIEAICEYYIEGGGKKASYYEKAWANIELSGEAVFSCEDLVPSLGKKFEENPEDVELLKKIITLLDKKGCTDDELYFNATVKLYDIEPSPESAFLIGKMYYKKENFLKAAEYLEQASGMTDSTDLANSYLLLATTYLNMKQYSNGRTAALNAAKYKPGDGRPYMLIGDMYAASAGSCGDNKLTSKVAFWAAVDKYYRAKTVDPSIEGEANQKIATYSAYFPVTEDIFFYGLQEGDTYTVECWINETTKVRAHK